jgi:hypothetical protein
VVQVVATALTLTLAAAAAPRKNLERMGVKAIVVAQRFGQKPSEEIRNQGNTLILLHRPKRKLIYHDGQILLYETLYNNK